MASSVFGIDLGTTYSCIAYIDEAGNPIVANNLDGSNITPSVVCFEDDGKVTVGEYAKQSAVLSPDRTVQFVKRVIGKQQFVKEIDGKPRTPEEVSSYILRKVTEDAAQITGMDVKDVVITVPAYFGNDERTATKNAGEIAGLNVLQIVQEPVAAAVFYGCTKSEEDTTALVYDLGGGTFDVTVVGVEHTDSGNTISVICSDGNAALGGGDWDQVLIRHLKEAFIEETDYDEEFDDEALLTLQQQAENAKKSLSTKDEARVVLNIDGIPARLNVTRDEFDAMTAHLLAQTIDITEKCIANAAEKGSVVDRILLVGGSTRMPQVMKALQEKFPDLPIEITDPDQAVAKGAALSALDAALTAIEDEADASAGEEAGGEEAKTVAEDSLVRNFVLPGAAAPTRNTIQYSTSKSYGLEVFDASNNQMVVNNLIFKNTPIPVDDGFVAVTETRYGTSVANQAELEFKIYENDSEEAVNPIDREPIIIQTVQLQDQGLPEQSPIHVTFKLDTEGLLTVSALEPKSGQDLEFDVQVQGLSADELEEIKSAALAMVVE